MPWWGSKKKHKSSKRPSRRSTRPVEYHDQPTYSSYPTQYSASYPQNYSSHEYYEPAPSSRPYLTSLPPELKYNIFERLDPVSSACLGLSSKTLYPHHRSSHRKVGLFESSRDHPLPLCFSMRVPSDLVLDWESEKFVTRERLAELEKKRRRENRDYWDTKKRSYGENQGSRGYEPERSNERRHERHDKHERHERTYDREYDRSHHRSSRRR